MSINFISSVKRKRKDFWRVFCTQNALCARVIWKSVLGIKTPTGKTFFVLFKYEFSFFKLFVNIRIHFQETASKVKNGSKLKLYIHVFYVLIKIKQAAMSKINLNVKY